MTPHSGTAQKESVDRKEETHTHDTRQKARNRKLKMTPLSAFARKTIGASNKYGEITC